jgi:hypothetical protein
MRCIKKSIIDRSGKATIIETGNRFDFVWGVLYDLDDREKPHLDRYEGLGNGYSEDEFIFQSRSGEYRAQVYIGEEDHIDPEVLPYRWYKEFIVRGAKEHRLPMWYLERLRTLKDMEDLDEIRNKVNSDIIEGFMNKDPQLV